MNPATQLGKRIHYLRVKRSWSQEELGFESGINKNYISDLERGKRNPTLILLLRLAEALEMDVSTLLKGIESEEN
jgi:transcriptional regulator with XRE-family HTH domain